MIGEFLKFLFSLGFFTYIITFLLSFAIIFALLRRTQMFDTITCAIISFSVSFLIILYPLFLGIDISPFLSVYFTQIFIFLIFLTIAFAAASLFYPELNEQLKKFFVTRGALAAIIALSFVLLILSGAFTVILIPAPTVKIKEGIEVQPSPPLPQDILTLLITIAGLIIFGVVIIISSRMIS